MGAASHHEEFVPDPAPSTVGASRASVVRLMLPTDANFTGNVFGGSILEEVDRVAYIAASRHAQANCVTASFDRVDFIAPVHVGELVTFDAELTFAGRTAMEVWVRVRSEEIQSREVRRVAQAFVTMVAVGPDLRPVPVPPLVLADDGERRRFEEGRQRMEARRSSRRLPED
jgi:acyl-CoA hydrolase